MMKKEKPKARNAPRDFTFEIIDHYPMKGQPDKGTFHAFCEEKGEDFRGVRYTIRKGKPPWVCLPGAYGEIDGEPCFYTFYSLANGKKMASFMKCLRHAFAKYWKQLELEKKNAKK